MARELLAAFRTILTFLLLSWGAILYLIVYRIPALDTDYVLLTGTEESQKELGKRRWNRLHGSYEEHGARELWQARQNTTVESHENIPLFNKFFNRDTVRNVTESMLLNKNILLQEVTRTNSLCQELQQAKYVNVIGQGYTKIVRKVIIQGRSVAVKSVYKDGYDIKNCMKGKETTELVRCTNLATYKLLREAVLLSQLRTPHIVQLLGSCIWTRISNSDVSSVGDDIVVITELGEPLSLLNLIRMAWDERFKMSLDLLSLLEYLSRSPFGSLTITDFKIDQFVVVKGHVRLSDVDDLDNAQKACLSEADCFIGGDRWNATLPCVRSQCLHYNEKLNLYNLYRLFLDYTLDFENPVGLEKDLAVVAKKIRNFECRVNEVLVFFMNIIRDIRNGEYALRWLTSGLRRTKFKSLKGAYVPASLFDYYCQRSRSLTSCELNVFDLEEAEVICAKDKFCKAIVITPHFNWLGQRIVELKSNSKILMSHSEYSVLVKE